MRTDIGAQTLATISPRSVRSSAPAPTKSARRSRRASAAIQRRRARKLAKACKRVLLTQAYRSGNPWAVRTVKLGTWLPAGNGGGLADVSPPTKGAQTGPGGTFVLAP